MRIVFETAKIGWNVIICDGSSQLRRQIQQLKFSIRNKEPKVTGDGIGVKRIHLKRSMGWRNKELPAFGRSKRGSGE